MTTRKPRPFFDEADPRLREVVALMAFRIADIATDIADEQATVMGYRPLTVMERDIHRYDLAYALSECFARAFRGFALEEAEDFFNTE